MATAERDAPSTAPFSAVQPLDEHNRRLLENAHPRDWTNPEPKDHYHLVVIGAGTGGLVTAAIGAALGARVALVERELMGGDCLAVRDRDGQDGAPAAPAVHRLHADTEAGGRVADPEQPAGLLDEAVACPDGAGPGTRERVDGFLDRNGSAGCAHCQAP